MINPSPGRRQESYLKQYWIIVNWTDSNKLQWYFSQNTKISWKKMNLNLRLKWWSFYLRPLCVGLSRSRVSIRLNNSLWTGGAIWRHSSRSAAVQVMACKLDVTKPYTEPISRNKYMYLIYVLTPGFANRPIVPKNVYIWFMYISWIDSFLIYDVDTPPMVYCSIYMRVVTRGELVLWNHQMNLVSF